jgi:hypothetical protein
MALDDPLAEGFYDELSTPHRGKQKVENPVIRYVAVRVGQRSTFSMMLVILNVVIAGALTHQGRFFRAVPLVLRIRRHLDRVLQCV